MRYLAIVAVALAVGSFGMAGAAQAADSTVCSAGADFTSVQAAIDDAGTGPGDTITLCAETFAENDIVIDKPVTIAGSGAGQTFLEPGGIGFRPAADGIVIKSMTIQNGLQAIRFEDAGGTIDGTEIRNVRIVNNSSNGIEIHNATTVTDLHVEQTSFIGNSAGLRVSSSGHLDGAVFRHALFDGNRIGIYEANDGNSSTMRNLLVTRSTFAHHTAGQGTAIYLEEIQNAVIKKNRFVGNRRDIQIFKWYQASLPVSNVVIKKNTMIGTTNAVLAIFNAHHTSGQTLFDGISFTNNRARTNGASAVFAGAHSSFQNADPSDGGIGWDSVTVSCNSFLGITAVGNGVRFFDPDGLDGDTLGGETIDVSHNWWGTRSKQAVRDLMQAPDITDFRPILRSKPSASCLRDDDDESDDDEGDDD